MINHNHTHEDDNDTVEPRGSWPGLLAGLLIGGLAGALAMLLLAPQSGKKTRIKLQRQSHKLREQTAETMGDAVEQARDKARQVTHDVRKQAEELEHRGQAILDGQKRR